MPTTIRIPGGFRDVLTANRNYYVATTGNDTTGDGSVGAPWKTIQYAANFIGRTLDLVGQYTVTVNVATGTYAEAPTINVDPVGAFPKSVIFLGDVTTPANCIISGMGVVISGCKAYKFSGFKLVGAYYGSGISAANGAVLFVSALHIALHPVLAYTCLSADGPSILTVEAGPMTCDGGSMNGWVWCDFNGTLVVNLSVPVSFINNPTLVFGTATAKRNGLIQDLGFYSGTATGPRYLADTNGTIFVGSGGGANKFPGTVAGSVTTGGIYYQ